MQLRVEETKLLSWLLTQPFADLSPFLASVYKVNKFFMISRHCFSCCAVFFINDENKLNIMKDHALL